MRRSVATVVAAATTTIIWTGTARADQCAWVMPAEAKKARKILEGVAEIVEYCELCTGDKPKAKRVQEVGVKSVEGGRIEVYVNGDPIDLAYVFVPSRDGEKRYDNLSKLAGCESTGVSPSIVYPPEVGAEPKSWAGRYVRGDVLWYLSKESGPSYSLQVDFTAPGTSATRGMLAAQAELDGERLVMAVPFPGCSLEVRRKSGADDVLVVGAKGNCGGMGDFLGGEYKRRE